MVDSIIIHVILIILCLMYTYCIKGNFGGGNIGITINLPKFLQPNTSFNTKRDRILENLPSTHK